MNKRPSISFILILLSIIFNINAAQKAEISKARKLLIAKIEKTIESEQIIKSLQKLQLDILKERKANRMLKSDEYFLYNTRIGIWVKYRWFIADTGLSRKWLKQVKELVDYMYKTQSYIETAQSNRSTQTQKYQQAVKYFDVAYERFVKLIKKPVKVSSKLQRKAKLQKALWQDAMRKKYKIKKSEPDFL